MLKQCAHELGVPLTTVFSVYFLESSWPIVWKEALVVPVHKRSSLSDPENYRSISLHSVVLEVLTDVVCCQLNDNNLLSDQRLG